MDSAKNAIVGQFSVSMILQFFLSGALSLLWNIFNTLQILLALNLLLVDLPANITLIRDFMYDTVNFQIIDKKVLYESLMGEILVFSEKE